MRKKIATLASAVLAMFCLANFASPRKAKPAAEMPSGNMAPVTFYTAACMIRTRKQRNFQTALLVVVAFKAVNYAANHPTLRCLRSGCSTSKSGAVPLLLLLSSDSRMSVPFWPATRHSAMFGLCLSPFAPRMFLKWCSTTARVGTTEGIDI